jgi:hypothetical protein
LTPVGNPSPIAGGDAHPTDDPQVEALIRLQLACQLALEALPALQSQTERALRHPVETLCDVTTEELDRLHPGWRDLPVFS